MYLMIQGRGEEALVQAKRARDLDPISRGPNSVVIYALLLARQLDEALNRTRDLLAMEPNNPEVHVVLAQVHRARKERAEELAALKEAIRLGDDSPDEQIFLGSTYARMGQSATARAILRQLEHSKQYVSPVGFAILHTALGERDKALALLETAYDAHDQQLIWLRIESGPEGAFGALAGEARFEDLLRQLGLK